VPTPEQISPNLKIIIDFFAISYILVPKIFLFFPLMLPYRVSSTNSQVRDEGRILR
jgi:hypothetical protein